jgi:hypothetical protein
MLSATKNAARSPEAADLEVGMAIVARARNHLNLQFWWAAA